MKQNDDVLHNYTVTDLHILTCSVDFNNSNSFFYYNKFKHRFETYNVIEYPVVLVECTYHSA